MKAILILLSLAIVCVGAVRLYNAGWWEHIVGSPATHAGQKVIESSAADQALDPHTNAGTDETLPVEPKVPSGIIDDENEVTFVRLNPSSAFETNEGSSQLLTVRRESVFGAIMDIGPRLNVNSNSAFQLRPAKKGGSSNENKE